MLEVSLLGVRAVLRLEWIMGNQWMVSLLRQEHTSMPLPSKLS